VCVSVRLVAQSEQPLSSFEREVGSGISRTRPEMPPQAQRQKSQKHMHLFT
jgi:hypothetical protein